WATTEAAGSPHLFSGMFIGFMKNPDDSLVFIDGLWALAFGSNANNNVSGAGPATTLFFTAGINGEKKGLFGTLPRPTGSTATRNRNNKDRRENSTFRITAGWNFLGD